MAKSQDVLQQYSALRAALERERDLLENRLKQINAVLDAPGVSSSVSLPTFRATDRKTKIARPKNSMNLREAIAKVTTKKSLSIPEIVEAVGQIGYKFATSNPANSVGAYLYGTGKKEFKRVDGKFAAK